MGARAREGFGSFHCTKKLPKKIKKVLDKRQFKCYNTIREREMREIEHSQIGLQLKVVREYSSFISKVLSKL